MYIRVGINGFGRIGRVVLRACLQNPDLQVAAINDPALDVEYICYLIKFDSTHGKLDGSIVYNKNEITLNDNIIIRVYNEKSPPEIPWHLAGVNYVVEASGMFTTMEKAMVSDYEAEDRACEFRKEITVNNTSMVADDDILVPTTQGHLINDCVKQVIVTAPSIDIPMIILGVNEEKLTADQKIISAGSSTLYCLAPIIKILEDKFGVNEGFVTSIHAMTPSMKPLDGLCLRGKHWRDHRSAVQNIIPAATGACKALGKIIPKAKDKLTGLAFRVPIVNVSVLDLSVKLVTPTSLDNIAKEVDEASRTSMKNIVKVSNEEAVSSDFMKDSHSCILDLDASLQLRPTSFKLICWYENEYSYASRVLDYIIFNEDKLNLSNRVISSCCSKIMKTNSKSSLCQYFKGDAKENVAVLTAKISIRGMPEIVPNKTIRSRLPDKDDVKEDNTLKLMICKKPVVNNAQETRQNQIPRVLKKTKSLSGPWNKKKDLLDTWVDTNKTKKNKNFYDFGSRYTENLDSVRPHQEHLEKIKEHFNKVANITEALLKKSCSRKFQSTSKSWEDDFKSTVAQSGKGLESMKDDHSKIKEENTNKPLPENNEVDKKTSDAIDDALKKRDDEEIPVIAEEESQVLCVTNFDSIEPVQNSVRILSSTKLTKEDKTLEIDYSKHESDNIYQISENKNYCIESMSSGSSKGDLYSSHKIPMETLNASFTKDNKKENDNETINNNLEIINSQKASLTIGPTQNVLDDSSIINNLSSNFYNLLLTNKNDLIVEGEEESNSNNTNLDCCPFLDLKTKIDGKDDLEPIDDAEANVNIEPNDDTKANEDTETNDINGELENVVNDQLIENTSTKNLLLPLNQDDILEVKAQKKSHLFGTLDNIDPSKCPSVQLTTVSSKADVYEGKSDIYDKLDSKSASDASENSFQIEEKKSQIIDITDVSKSLEDLERIDKLCRIIEISDDLSDRLFSNLESNDSDTTPVAGRVWSFNDMCKKIKFDEFCDKLFRNDSS